MAEQRARRSGAADRISAGAPVTHRNEVLLVGRLAVAPEVRILPSGDEIVSWRLIVDRPDRRTRRVVDVIDCASFTPRLRRAAVRWQPGDVIEVQGALRRRFWRGPAGPGSRYEVDATRAARRAEAT